MGRRGPMPGTGGRPRKALAEKLANGNPGHRPLKVINIPEGDVKGELVIPAPMKYLSSNQKNGGNFCAEDIYYSTYQWLADTGCEKLISTYLVNQYAMSVARWIQCEEAISNFGFLAKHPTTGQAIASPYVGIAQSYMKQAMQQWAIIFQIVKDNCTEELTGSTPQDDAMELLLRARLGR